MGERFPRSSRIPAKAGFDRCYRLGRRRGGALFTLHAAAGEGTASRLGVSAARAVGGSVTRHRLKRWCRECFRRSGLPGGANPWDIVVHLKPAAARADFAVFRAEFERCFAELRPVPPAGNVSR